MFYRVGGIDLKVGLVLVNSDQIVLQMFEVSKNYSTIDRHVGELLVVVNDANELLVADNFGQQNDNFVVENLVNEVDDSDGSNAAYRDEDGENEPSDSKLDLILNYF